MEQLPSGKRNTQSTQPNATNSQDSTGTMCKKASHTCLFGTASLTSALMQSLLHEWGNVLPGSHLRSLPRLLEHGFNQNAVADFASSLSMAESRGKHISTPVHITQQQQKRGTQQSLMPAEPTATGPPLSHGKKEAWDASFPKQRVRKCKGDELSQQW